MASNMLKQALPLAEPQAPLVGTGEERAVMLAAGHNLLADQHCVVVRADAAQVVVYCPCADAYKAYLVPEPTRSNQGVCRRLRVVVEPNQVLKAGDVVAECQSSDNGEMSLGANLLVAFMC